MNNLTRTILLAAAAVVLIGGCASGEKDGLTHRDAFFDDAPKRLFDNAARQQLASGARADATLYPAHFHGTELNSLGMTKIDLMAADDDTSSPMVVYLGLPTDEALQARQAAVLAYVVAKGKSAEQVKFETGANPNHAFSAEVQSQALKEVKSGGGSGSSSSSMGAQ